jgi:hypothetical protein
VYVSGAGAGAGGPPESDTPTTPTTLTTNTTNTTNTAYNSANTTMLLTTYAWDNFRLLQCGIGSARRSGGSKRLRWVTHSLLLSLSLSLPLSSLSPLVFLPLFLPPSSDPSLIICAPAGTFNTSLACPWGPGRHLAPLHGLPIHPPQLHFQPHRR